MKEGLFIQNQGSCASFLTFSGRSDKNANDSEARHNFDCNDV